MRAESSVWMHVMHSCMLFYYVEFCGSVRLIDLEIMRPVFFPTCMCNGVPKVFGIRSSLISQSPTKEYFTLCTNANINNIFTLERHCTLKRVQTSLLDVLKLQPEPIKARYTSPSGIRPGTAVLRSEVWSRTQREVCTTLPAISPSRFFCSTSL